MDTHIEFVYKQYILPLSFNDRIFMVQRILQDFTVAENKVLVPKSQRLAQLQRFKGIGRTNGYTPSAEDWYRQ